MKMGNYSSEELIIPIGFGNNAKNEGESVLWILESESSKPGILALPKWAQWITLCISVLAFLIGSYFKGILYFYLHARYKLKEFTPINVLILVVSLIQHTLHALYVINGILVISYASTLPSLTGRFYWFMFFHARKLEIIYLIVGSFGISLFRILYIKKEGWVKHTIGEKTLLKIILFGGVGLAILLVILGRGATNYHLWLEQNCAQPGRLFLEIMIAYTPY